MALIWLLFGKPMPNILRMFSLGSIFSSAETSQQTQNAPLTSKYFYGLVIYFGTNSKCSKNVLFRYYFFVVQYRRKNEILPLTLAYGSTLVIFGEPIPRIYSSGSSFVTMNWGTIFVGMTELRWCCNVNLARRV